MMPLQNALLERQEELEAKHGNAKNGILRPRGG